MAQTKWTKLIIYDSKLLNSLDFFVNLFLNAASSQIGEGKDHLASLSSSRECVSAELDEPAALALAGAVKLVLKEGAATEVLVD